MVQHQ